MNTAGNEHNARFTGALHYLEAVAGNIPINATLTELQLVIERMTFSGYAANRDVDQAQLALRVEALFRDEVSAAMMDFILWLTRGDQLDLIDGATGRSFLTFADNAYRKIPEVQFITAVTLTDEFKMTVIDRLRVIYPAPARILFSTSPMVTAGFILQVGQTVVDRSLRSFAASTIPRTGRFQDLGQVTQ